jgi:hypothetical protein
MAIIYSPEFAHKTDNVIFTRKAREGNCDRYLTAIEHSKRSDSSMGSDSKNGKLFF